MFPKTSRSPAWKKGRLTENVAAEYLRKQGLKVCDTNFRCKMGELDIVARDGKTLVFVEVRYRKSKAYGTPAETVDFKKQQRLIRASQFYLQRHDLDMPCRFDIVEGYKDKNQLSINWIKDAFQSF